MIKRKRKPSVPKARIPSEIIAVESLVKAGHIRFRCHWQIYDFGSLAEPKRGPRWQQIRSKIFKFSAGSMEELLAAVHAAVLAAAEMPGVKLEAMWRKFCPSCGRVLTIGEHECPDKEEQVRVMLDGKRKKGLL